MEFLNTLSYLLINVLLPLSIVVVLVFLAILIYHLIILMKSVKIITDDVEYKLELLKEPVGTLASVNQNYLKYVATFSAAFAAIRSVLKRDKKVKKKKK